MPVKPPRPDIDGLQQEYILVQAWKKTASFIRYHNWFSDTLELDRAAVNLPEFLQRVKDRILNTSDPINDPLRMVPAPKSQAWEISDTGEWRPKRRTNAAAEIRPLAHVSLVDQVVATAMMLCLADRAETAQGDPSIMVESTDRSRTISYGNRLFCDAREHSLSHRWGSSKLYRQYYQDYQTFLARPDRVADTLDSAPGEILIVQSDLKQFYDRVTPGLLATKVRKLRNDTDDENFFNFFELMFDWRWAKEDNAEVGIYAKQAGIGDFSRIALPQGLVASGFFANIVLIDFDNALRSSIDKEIIPGCILKDACRYVDDLRLVIANESRQDLDEIRQKVFSWISSLLDVQAPGLSPSLAKTHVTQHRGDAKPLIRQSRRMARIQTAISGGFDVAGGGEILDAVLGLMQTQARSARQATTSPNTPFAPIPDVRDTTVERFAAGRFRATYRSLRPLLWDEVAKLQISEEEGNFDSQPSGDRSKEELDDEARAFALSLINNWVDDPSNVRLLRIGLDIWPASDVLEDVLRLLRPFTEKGGRRKAPRRVAWYCLSEILRAGVTETGVVPDDESLPSAINLTAYRRVLQAEAKRILLEKNAILPWYLKQQALLVVAANPDNSETVIRRGGGKYTSPYRDLIRATRGEFSGLTNADFATFSTIVRRSFLSEQKALSLVTPQLTAARLARIAALDPLFAHELSNARPDLKSDLPPRIIDDLCLLPDAATVGPSPLATMVLGDDGWIILRNEISVLTFASEFLAAYDEVRGATAISPSDVNLETEPSKAPGLMRVRKVHIRGPRNLAGRSMYEPPYWVDTSDRWRHQLGYLIRFILSGHPDFTRSVSKPSWREDRNTYRATSSHWYQRMYALFNGHAAFGDDWLPISEWTESLLFSLLAWPGCYFGEHSFKEIAPADLRTQIDERVRALEAMQGSSTALMPLRLPLPGTVSQERPLRACVVQTIIPGEETDFDINDLTLSKTNTRRRHRRHLSAALSAVQKMLTLRETHRGRDGRLDLLILPELAVHPADVATHLIPFARRYKATILAGVTFQAMLGGDTLFNSALWIVPTWSATRGLQVLIRRQGKANLAPIEQQLNAQGAQIKGFRPCQWLIGYPWSPNPNHAPLWLSAAVCYDATDLRLAADLKHHSDVFIIPALNMDVDTFDHMALALHYHMYQMVIVANNGSFGGTNAYAPFRTSFERQVFHLHGQPQATVAFFEIDQLQSFIERRKSGSILAPPASAASKVAGYTFKFPPAG